MEQFRDGGGRRLRLVVVGARAAHPEQVVDARGVLHVLAHDGDLEIEALGPVHALAGGLVVGVRLGLHAPEGSRQFAGEGGLHEDLVAAQVQDVVDVLDVNGALLHARAAVRAVPQDLLGDDAGHQGARHVEDTAGACGARRGQGGDQVEGVRGGGDALVEQNGVLLPGRLGSGRPGPGSAVPIGSRVAVGAGDDLLGGGGLHVVAQAHDEELGGQGLLGVPRGAQLLAPPAFSAGVEVEARFPREVLDRAHAQGGVLGELVEVVGGGDGLSVNEHVVGGPQGLRAVGVAAGVQVEDGDEAVPGDAHAGLHSDDHQPHHRRDDLDG